jgi:hypothetical protein
MMQNHIAKYVTEDCFFPHVQGVGWSLLGIMLKQWRKYGIQARTIYIDILLSLLTFPLIINFQIASSVPGAGRC